MVENAVPRPKVLLTATISEAKETAFCVGKVPVEQHHKKSLFFVLT